MPVSDGLFSVGLGSQTSGGIPTSVWGGDRYLETTVGGETLSPRELIRSVPVAGMALTVPDGAVTNEKLALSYWSASPADTVDITSTDANAPNEIVSLSVNFPVDGIYLLFAKVVSQSDAADQQLHAYIWDENGTIGQAKAINTHPKADGNGRETGTIVTVAPFPAGAHTIRLMARMYTGSGGSVMPISELVVIPFGQP